MACTRSAIAPTFFRRRAPTHQTRTLFNFPSPFGSSSSSSSNAPVKKGTLVKRGSNWVYNEGKVMPYTPNELYAVIADVDSYHQFLPFTTSSKVLAASRLSQASPTARANVAEKGWLQVGDGCQGQKWVMDAELRIGAMGFDEGYVSRVEMEIPTSVKATAKDASMFRHLVNVWTFTPLSASSPSSRPQTQVDLSLEYAFTSPFHAAAITTVWDKVSALMVQKFEDRVVEIHGKRRDEPSEAKTSAVFPPLDLILVPKNRNFSMSVGSITSRAELDAAVATSGKTVVIGFLNGYNDSTIPFRDLTSALRSIKYSEDILPFWQDRVENANANADDYAFFEIDWESDIVDEVDDIDEYTFSATPSFRIFRGGKLERDITTGNQNGIAFAVLQLQLFTKSS
ncbi:hypothetical protein JCM11491_006530 [Sporobolomyces phaffii]